MAAVPPLTPEKSLAARVHHMRMARGACWVIVVALLGVALLTLLDAIIYLPDWIRGLGLAVWLTGFGVLTWRLVVRRWRDEAAGSSAARQARKDLPGNLNAAAAAALALAGCLLAATFVPGTTEHLRRVALPWYRPAASHYRVVVTSGEPLVRTGDPVTLAAYVEKIDPSSLIPDTATAYCRSGERRWMIPMMGDGTGTFHVTLPAVVSDFEYRVDVGNAASDWYAVSAVDPAEPTEQSMVEVSPPKYAASVVTKRTFAGFVPFEGFQYATVELRLRFSHPATEAFLAWRPDGGSRDEVTRLTLAADNLSSNATLQLKQDGTLRLVTVAARNGKTLPGSTPVRVRVTRDVPPRFERIAGASTRPMNVRPGDRLSIEFTAVDDVAIGAAMLEYVLGSDFSRAVSIPIPLTGSGTARAEGRYDFDLPGKLREGETVRYRIRVADVRRLDDSDLKPQEAIYPESGWAAVTARLASPPLDQQEIQGQRDNVQTTLEAALIELSSAAEAATIVQTETSGKAILADEQTVRLNNARERGRKAAGILLEAARDTALTPDLRPLAAAIREVSDRRLQEVEENLRKAATNSPTERARTLAEGIKQLTAAMDRLNQLRDRNQRLAQTRLDRTRITALLVGQANLADRSRPEANTPPAELARLQEELLNRLAKLLAESPPLRAAVDEARQDEFRSLAATAASVAGKIRELELATKELDAEVRHRLFRAIASDQAEVARNAATLLAKIETATRLVGVGAPKPEEFFRAGDLIAGGKTIASLTELERLAKALDAVAIPFEKWATDRDDVKVAARQLSLWQDDLLTRFRGSTAGQPANFELLPAAIRSAFRTEQAALRRAVAELAIPITTDLTNTRNEALKQLGAAASSLEGTGTGTDVAMKNASDALNRLADRMPTLPERLVKTRGALEKLRQDQEALRNAIAQEIQGIVDPGALARKLAPRLTRQRQLTAAFAALDLPGLQARRERSLAALDVAEADLREGLPFDVSASQAWVKREFDRLKVAVDGFPPPDDRAAALARRLDRMPTPDEMQDVIRQIDLFNQVSAPEAAALRNDAQEAVRFADAGLRDRLPPIEQQHRLRAAAEAIRRLSLRLSGGESDLERIQRLAWNRRQAIENPRGQKDVARQLSREGEELALTRVGSSGQVGATAQVLKQRVLNQYARLAAQTEPDRQPDLQKNLQKTLADTLDELAGMMADVPDLTATFDRVLPSPGRTEADVYLPSTYLADALRKLAHQEHALRERINGLSAEVEKRTRPAEGNLLAEPLKKQRELVTDVLALGQVLDSDRILTNLSRTAAESSRLTAEALTNGLVRSANEFAERTVRSLRELAELGHDKSWAKAAVDLANRQEMSLRVIMTLLGVPAASAAQQRTRMEELAAEAAEFSQVLERTARRFGPDNPITPTLTTVGQTAKAAEKTLVEAARQAGAGMSTDVPKRLRMEALSLMQGAAEKLAVLTPLHPPAHELDAPARETGYSIRQAEVAMQEAIRLLGPNPDRVSAEKAIANAMNALKGAATGRMGSDD